MLKSLLSIILSPVIQVLRISYPAIEFKIVKEDIVSKLDDNPYRIDFTIAARSLGTTYSYRVLLLEVNAAATLKKQQFEAGMRKVGMGRHPGKQRL
jgi:hypothetical protein